MGALCPSFGVGLINVIAVSVYGIFKAELFKWLYLSFWFFFFDFWKMFDNFSGLLLLLILSSSLSYYSTHTACKTVKLVLIGHMTVSYHMITYDLNSSNCLNCFFLSFVYIPILHLSHLETSFAHYSDFSCKKKKS